MAVVESILNNKRLCACGCGQERPAVDKQGRERRFIDGHNARLQPKGENSPLFKVGRTNNREYQLVLKPDHPRADKGGYVPEHIIVFEQYDEHPEHGCCTLKWNCAVHHINEKPWDNRLENLQGMTNSQHNRLHRKGKKASYEARRNMSLSSITHDIYQRFCSICGSKETYMQKTKYAGLRPNWYIDKETGLFICLACRIEQRNEEVRIKKLATTLLQTEEKEERTNELTTPTIMVSKKI